MLKSLIISYCNFLEVARSGSTFNRIGFLRANLTISYTESVSVALNKRV